MLFERPIAHRGLHDRAAGIIENSRSAFEAAIDAGYAIECDVQLSSDGVPFIFHDDGFGRLTRSGASVGTLPIAQIVELTLIGSRANDAPQRLDTFLDQMAGRTIVQLELKMQSNADRTRQLARSVVETLSSYKGRIAVESFDPRLLGALRDHGVPFPVGIVTEAHSDPGLPAWKRFVLRHLLHWPWTRFNFVSCRASDLRLPAIRFFRMLGMETTAWTIKSAPAAEAVRHLADQIVFEGFRPAIA